MKSINTSDFVVSPLGGGLLPLIGKVPAPYQQYFIPGCSNHFADMGKGQKVLLQQIMFHDCLLQVCHADLSRYAYTGIANTDSGSFCTFFVTLKGYCELVSKQFGEYALPARSVQVFSAPELEGTILLGAGSNILLAVHCPKVYLKQKGLLDPKEHFLFLQQMEEDVPAVLAPTGTRAGAAVIDLGSRLIQSSYDPFPRPAQHELFNHFLAAMIRTCAKPLAVTFSTEEVASLHAVKAKIDQQPDKEHRFNALAKEAGMNLRKLAAGFKDLFDMELLEYARYVRLEEAKRVLETTGTPMKVVSLNAGYHNLSNFCTAFKKVYGVTPYSVRKL